jgi:hypothetical protein
VGRQRLRRQRYAAELTLSFIVLALVALAGCGGHGRAASFGSPVATDGGSTDDTAALLAAAGKGPILLPAGTYRVKDLKLPVGTTIEGSGDSTIIRGRITLTSGCTMSSVKVGAPGESLSTSNGAHNVLCQHVTVVGGSARSAVVSLDSACHDIVFRHCTIAVGGGWDGVSIVDYGGTIHGIVFDECHFMSQGRMGFECISRGSSTAIYQNVDLLNCTFEPQGAEAISFDGPPVPAHCVVQGNLVKGAGIGSYPWGQGFEINGPQAFAVVGNRFYACRGDTWNLSGGSAKPCGWVFKDNVVDASRSFQSVPMASDSNCISMSGVYGGVFSHNAITSAAPGGGVAWMTNCHGNDFRTTTWHDARSTPYSTPQQINCSGNLF